METSVKHAVKAAVVDIPNESKWESNMRDSRAELHKIEMSANIHHIVHNRRAVPSCEECLER